MGVQVLLDTSVLPDLVVPRRCPATQALLDDPEAFTQLLSHQARLTHISGISRLCPGLKAPRIRVAKAQNGLLFYHCYLPSSECASYSWWLTSAPVGVSKTLHTSFPFCAISNAATASCMERTWVIRGFTSTFPWEISCIAFGKW